MTITKSHQRNNLSPHGKLKPNQHTSFVKLIKFLNLDGGIKLKTKV